MDWIPERAPIKPQTPIKLEPEHTLYYFDGPVFFTATFLDRKSIFIKVLEAEEIDRYLVAPILDPKTVAAVEKAEISARSPFLVPDLILAETEAENGAYHVTRYWTCPLAELPDDFLPSPGIGLPTGTRAPDTPPTSDNESSRS